jgi:hypothetical protein
MKKNSLVSFFVLCAFASIAQWNTSSTNIYNSNTGNVGIGTSAPTAKLEINPGWTGQSQGLRIWGGNSYNAFGNTQILFSYGGGGGYSHTIKTRHMSSAVAGNAFDFYVWQPGDAITAEGSLHVMSLNGDKVGIGTTAPGYKLDVFGVTATQGIRIPNRFTFGQAESAIEFEVPTNSYNAIRGYNGTQHIGTIHFFDDTWGSGQPSQSAGSINLSPLSAVTFGTWSAPTAYFRSGDGYVGIGTTSPGNKLTIATGSGTPRTGAVGIQLYNGNSNADSRNWMIETPFTGAGNFNISQYQDAAAGGAVARLLILPTNGYNRSADLTINDSGSVGIGTTTPSAKLDIAGSGSTNVDLKINGRIQSGDGANAGGMHLGTTGMFMGQTNATALGLWNNGAWRLIADNNGNIGIGTLVPTQKLTVNGTIYGKEVKVDLNVPGPDYVFEKDYKLPSLDEIKSYIDQHKHLPEVPSAKDMEKNGINVSEMNMILLKKVEELTLMMIKQNELIENQNKRIHALEMKD